ncbi:MAG: 50S ribosomal protein L10 [delta proteobacterium ML8_F1]|nr:MAG: 50S ribosomal protein L10 [delta proteobacterium ML8_F1]
MSKNFENKKLVVDEIKGKFQGAKAAVLVDYRGLNVAQTTELRKRFREAGVEYKVYKNNLVKLAIKDTEFEPLEKDLLGPNAIAFGYEDAVTPAKIIKDFAKDHKQLELKTGVIEGEYYDVTKIVEIADIPSRDELIAKFMGSIKSPVSNFVYLLSNIIEEKEKEA